MAGVILHLPPDWFAVDLRPDRLPADVEALVCSRGALDPRLLLHRNALVAALSAAGAAARRDGALQWAGWADTDVAGRPVAAWLTVTRASGLAGRPAHVIAAALRARGWCVQVRPLRGRDAVHVAGTRPSGRPVPEPMRERQWWVPDPRGAPVVLSFATPSGHLAEGLERVFDAIAAALQVEADEPA